MIILGVAAVAALVAWVLDRRRRRYADQATTPAAALFAGFNLVAGRAWTATPLVSHRTSTDSVWWSYTLEEERRHTRTVSESDGKGGTRTRTETYTEWHTIETLNAELPEFEVVDDTGTALVRLAGAKVVARRVHHETFRRDDRGLIAKMVSNQTGRYRETEQVVAHGDQLFIAGEVELDQERLVPLISKKVMVSTRTERTHVRNLAIGVTASILVAVVAATAGIAMVLRPDAPGDPVAWAPGLVGALVALAIAWAVTTYNRLRLVAQAGNRAWSLIDVQLRRRRDLIPALQSCVSAHASHEQGALLAAVQARAATGQVGSANDTEADQLSDQAEAQTTTLRQLLAVAEAYPELTTDQAFAHLQRELADTEDRIAASRMFYNDSITLLRNRQESFPSMLVARRVILEHRDLIGTRGFERTVPSIEHAFN